VHGWTKTQIKFVCVHTI